MMTHQIEITFSYGEKTNKRRRIRRDVDWAAHFDDLFVGMTSLSKDELPQDSGTRTGTAKSDSPATKPTV